MASLTDIAIIHLYIDSSRHVNMSQYFLFYLKYLILAYDFYPAMSYIYLYYYVYIAYMVYVLTARAMKLLFKFSIRKIFENDEQSNKILSINSGLPFAGCRYSSVT